MKRQHKEPEIFAQRFLRSYRLLHFIACRVLGDDERAPVAIHNCWRTASRNPPYFEHESAFRSWMVRVLIDEFLVIFRDSPGEKGPTDAVVEDFGALPIDYRSSSVEEYVSKVTAGEGFDVVFDTVGGVTLDASFVAVKRYTGHVVSCLGWGTHSLAPLSFRGATYSGVFTLLPLLTGEGRAHHGEILATITALVETGKLKPLLNDHAMSIAEIDAAHALVESGALGKVVVELSS